jgi:hypothetical protein
MRLLYILLPALLWHSLPAQVSAQSISRTDQPRFTVSGYSEDGDKGMLMLTFGVSMSDCIQKVEIESLTNSKKRAVAYPTLDNYYVRDGDEEEIFANIPMGKFRKLVDRKEGLDARITITSKSGRVVFNGRATLKVRDDEPEDTPKATASNNIGRR